MMLIPAQPVPPLALETLDHGRFELTKDAGSAGTFALFYRGLHCPICLKQLAELDSKVSDFEGLDVTVVAISTDTSDRARQTADKAGISRLRIAHSLPLANARDDWGLYISSAREGSEEPALFSEPGHFYIDREGKLQFGWVQSAPFARPALDDILGAIKFSIEKQYPPRGMYTGPLGAAA